MVSKRQIDEAAKRVLGSVGDPQPQPDWIAKDYLAAMRHHTDKAVDANSDEESSRHYTLASRYHKAAVKLGWKIHKPQTRKWRGHDVDVDLADEVLARANTAADKLGGSLISICSGHPEGSTPGGGDEHPSFGISLEGHGEELEKKTEQVAAKLRGPNTTVETNWWSANAVTHSNGQSREHVFQQWGNWDQVRKGGTTRTGINVECTIASDGTNQAKLAAWWKQVLSRLEKV